MSALEQTIVAGLKTNLFFLKDLLKDSAFEHSTIYTTYLQEGYQAPDTTLRSYDIALMVAWAHHASGKEERRSQKKNAEASSAWWKSGLPQ